MQTVLTSQIPGLFCHPRVICAPEAGWLCHCQSLSLTVGAIQSQQEFDEWKDRWTDDKGMEWTNAWKNEQKNVCSTSCSKDLQAESK